MSTKNSSRLQRRNVLFDETQNEDEDDELLDPGLEDATVKTHFLAPTPGESYKDYASSYMNMDLLERGERDLLKFQESINGQVTHPIYELIRTNSLTPVTLASNSDKWTKESADSKYLFLKRRYYVDNDGIVRDRRKNHKIVCEPLFIFDLIMCGHLMNDHMTYRPLHRCLNKIYSNITRDFTQMAVRYCSNCNPDGHLKPLEKYRHKNIFRGLLPLERIHLETFEALDGTLMGGKYSHVLYCRDYHTRFVWLAPLKNSKFKHLVSSIGNLLLSMIRLPMFIESSTLSRQDLFDICEQLCGKYDLQIGLGVNKSSQFHLNGIKRMKKLLNGRKEDCISDWNMCLRNGPYYLNRTYNTLAVGIPNDLLYSLGSDSSREFKLKQEKIILESSAQNVVHVNKGMIYLEDESSSVIEDEEFENEDDENKNVTSNTQSVKRRTIDRSFPLDTIPTSPEISEPSTSYYQDLVSPSKKRVRIRT